MAFIKDEEEKVQNKDKENNLSGVEDSDVADVEQEEGYADHEKNSCISIYFQSGKPCFEEAIMMEFL